MNFADFQAIKVSIASPEQIRGEPITTASDVYSLGVVLYEWLTGHKPYRVKSESPHELLHAVLEEEPSHPSAANTIVRRASRVMGRAPPRASGLRPVTGPRRRPREADPQAHRENRDGRIGSGQSAVARPTSGASRIDLRPYPQARG